MFKLLWKVLDLKYFCYALTKYDSSNIFVFYSPKKLNFSLKLTVICDDRKKNKADS